MKKLFLSSSFKDVAKLFPDFTGEELKKAIQNCLKNTTQNSRIKSTIEGERENAEAQHRNPRRAHL